MSDHHVMKAMFTQQRIQIMHLGKHHKEYTDAYIFAWEFRIYPFMHDLGGDFQFLPHEIYSDFFEVSAEQGTQVYNRLSLAWAEKEEYLTYGDLEYEFRVGQTDGWRADELLNVCRYLFLMCCFDEPFWKQLCTPTEEAPYAEFVIDEYEPEHDTAFM